MKTFEQFTGIRLRVLMTDGKNEPSVTVRVCVRAHVVRVALFKRRLRCGSAAVFLLLFVMNIRHGHTVTGEKGFIAHQDTDNLV